MVTLTDDQWQSLVILTIGDEITPTWSAGVLTMNSALWWAKSDEFAYDPELRFLYAKRDAAEIILGIVRGYTNKTVGPLRLDQGHTPDVLQKTIATLTMEIDERLKQNADSGPVVGVISTVAPTVPLFPGDIDRNDSRLIGDPYQPFTTPR